VSFEDLHEGKFLLRRNPTVVLLGVDRPGGARDAPVDLVDRFQVVAVSPGPQTEACTTAENHGLVTLRDEAVLGRRVHGGDFLAVRVDPCVPDHESGRRLRLLRSRRRAHRTAESRLPIAWSDLPAVIGDHDDGNHQHQGSETLVLGDAVAEAEAHQHRDDRGECSRIFPERHDRQESCRRREDEHRRPHDDRKQLPAANDALGDILVAKEGDSSADTPRKRKRAGRGEAHPDGQ